jgi:hypothetical protein
MRDESAFDWNRYSKDLLQIALGSVVLLGIPLSCGVPVRQTIVPS